MKRILAILRELLPVGLPFYIGLITEDKRENHIYLSVNIEKSYCLDEDCNTIYQYHERATGTLTYLENK